MVAATCGVSGGEQGQSEPVFADKAHDGERRDEVCGAVSQAREQEKRGDAPPARWWKSSSMKMWRATLDGCDDADGNTSFRKKNFSARTASRFCARTMFSSTWRWRQHRAPSVQERDSGPPLI